jgi:hypothetical protein
MSYDRRIEQVCPHLVVEEALFLNADRRTVRPLRPIASAASVRVRFNGEQEITSVGHLIPAVAKGSSPGPFDIRAGVNDRLIVSVNGGPDQNFVAPTGLGITAKALTKALSSAVVGLVFRVSRRLQVQALTATRGPSARIVFKALPHSESGVPTGSLARTLGFTVGRVYRGQEVFPPWSLINDPNTLSDRPTRLIVFDRRIESATDFVEINYTTVRQECRRCGGVGIENDWQYTAAGNVIKVRNAELLSQEVLKITYTEKGSNPFHPWYGTGLLEAIGKKISDHGLMQNLILSDLQEAFRRWQAIKSEQEDRVQFVSDEEYPFRLLVVNLEQDPVNPTVVYVNAFVQNRSSSPIQISRGLQLPLPIDLLGSSVQDSLRRQNDVPALGR